MAPRHKGKSNLIPRNRLVATYKSSVKAKSNNQSVPAKEESSEEFFAKLPVKVETGLGENIDKYVSLSPTLTRQIQELRKRHWEFRWGDSDRGSGTVWLENHLPGYIFFDGANNPGTHTDFSAKFLIMSTVSTLAHEVAHALDDIQYDTSSHEACVRSALSGPGSEASATYNNILIRQEILMNTKNMYRQEDIVDNRKDDLKKMNEYQQIIHDNNKQEALYKIGDMYRTLRPSVQKNQTYEEYYGEHCDKLIAAKKH